MIDEEDIQYIANLQSKYYFRKQDSYLLLHVIDISLQRIQMGKALSTSIPKYINYFIESDIFTDLLTYLELKYAITISNYEVDFITFPLVLNGNHFRLEKSQAKDNHELKIVFERIKQVLKSKFFVELDFERLGNEISNHLVFLINRMIFKYKTTDLFRGEIEKKYPLSYQLALETVKVLSEHFQTPVFKTEVDYLTLYFELVSKSNGKHEERREIAIICNTGKATAGMVKRQIEKVIGQGIKITQFSEANYYQEDFKKYFAVITTVPLKNFPSDVPTIRLTNIFNDDYLFNEWNKLINSSNRMMLNTRFFLHHFIGDSYDFILKRMLDELFENKLVDQNFINKIYKRSTKHSYLINNGIIFPHEINDASKGIIMSIGIIKEPIYINKNYIDFIILGAIPRELKDNDQALLDVYDFIFGIFQNNDLKKKISQMESAEEIYHFLKEGG